MGHTEAAAPFLAQSSEQITSFCVYPRPFVLWRGEQLKWFLTFKLYIGSFPCAQLPGPVHAARLGRMFFLCI